MAAASFMGLGLNRGGRAHRKSVQGRNAEDHDLVPPRRGSVCGSGSPQVPVLKRQNTVAICSRDRPHWPQVEFPSASRGSLGRMALMSMPPGKILALASRREGINGVFFEGDVGDGKVLDDGRVEIVWPNLTHTTTHWPNTSWYVGRPRPNLFLESMGKPEANGSHCPEALQFSESDASSECSAIYQEAELVHPQVGPVVPAATRAPTTNWKSVGPASSRSELLNANSRSFAPSSIFSCEACQRKCSL